MAELTAVYRKQVETVSLNVCNSVMPMTQIPENLLEAYANLCNELIEDKDKKFSTAWSAFPASAKKLLPQADFHGFYIANAWFQLSRVAQDIAEMADSDDAINEKEYDGIFTRLADSALKETSRKLKKARTDRAMLNSIKQVIAG
ncbi:DUF3069 domain-containing protein [Shewanella surugensis]|uniref:DUF3069 domain-containing protein n=1 Tax=Shewanella surugensis TaxID=212020 RepID=A0ABT0L5H4_9GAMM|nr:DUF3069 domain-containing protein [Shewanella surugensis]MCL1122941.1 DUF3069 domain-containing protein [Shewanella surugensis]